MGEIVDIIGPSRTPSLRSKKGRGLALINAPLESIAKPLAIADKCRAQLQRHDFDTYLGEPGDLREGFLDRAKVVRARLLRDLVEVNAAHNTLLDVVAMPLQVSPSMAFDMLGALFGALTKSRTGGDNATALLAACVDMFDPLSNQIGSSTGLWKPVNKHPVVLALAIKQLLASSVFAPSPSELREAMIKVNQRIGALRRWTDQWLDLLDHADQITFKFDRAAWDASYVGFTDAAAVMMDHADLDRLESDDEDADPPRYVALREIGERRDA